MPPGPEPNPVTDFEAWWEWKAAERAEAAAAKDNAPKPGLAPVAPPAVQQQNANIEKEYTAGQPKPPTSAALPGTSTSPAPYTPAPYGNITTAQLQSKTIETGAGARVDPVSRQRYTQGSDGTWRTGGTVPFTEVQGLIKTYGLPPERQEALQNPQNPGTTLASNVALSANPGLASKGVNPGTSGTAGTLSAAQGVTLPGFEQFNIPGLGIESEGRKTIYGADSDLNTLRAGPPNGPQIQFAPGNRYPNSPRSDIQFGGSGSGARPNYNVDPQLRFGASAVSVPDTWERGAGNTGDSNRAVSLPFNIGPGGASLMNIGGSNVQVNSADKGTGTGFALTPQTPSDKFAATDFGAATGRSLNNDPALQSAQILSIIAALNQLGGGPGAISAMTTPNAGQYSGLPASGQGTYFSGMAPGPQNTPYAPSAGAGAGNGPPASFGLGALNSAGQALLGGLQPDEEKDRSFAEYADGGDFISMGRFGKQANRPLGAAADVIAPVMAGGTAPELARQSGGGADVARSGVAPAQPVSTEAAVTNQGGVAPAEPAVDVGGQLDLTGLATADDLQPFQEAANRVAGQQQQRASQNYIRNLAGLAPAQAVPIVSGQALGTLGPGQFWDTAGALTRSITGIADKQEKLRERGAAEDYETIIAEVARLRQQQAPFEQGMGLQTQIQGYGEVGDATALQEEINALKTAAGPLAGIQEAQGRLTELGNPYDEIELQQLADQINGIKQTAQNYGDPDPFTNPFEYNAQQQMLSSLSGLSNQLQQKQSHNNAIAQQKNSLNNLLASTGLTMDQIAPQLAQYQTQLDTKGTALTNAQKVAQLKQTLASLVGAGVDPTAKYSEIAALLQPLQANAQGVLGRNTERQTLAKEIQNLVKAGPPKFGAGGTMVTDEPVVGVGVITGKPRFIVGEPTRPGGPPRAERLKIEPMHKDVPMGKFAGAA